MRLSGDAKDPDYWRRHFNACPSVMLDGKLQHHVIEADTDKGFIVLEAWDNGRMVMDGGSIVTRRIEGVVQIFSHDPVTNSPRSPS